MSSKEGGWREKYAIFKTESIDGEVRLVEPDPNAQYFVLRIDTDLMQGKLCLLMRTALKARILY